MYKYSVKEAKRWIKAVDKIINNYKKLKKDERFTNEKTECPLCTEARDINTGLFNGCTRCPWVVFKGIICYHAEMEDGHRYTRKALPRLRGWKIRFQNIIKKGVKQDV